MSPRSRATAPAEAHPVLALEATLWKAADKLRGSLDASDYKHVVLGLIFLKYVDDSFLERQGALRAELEADGAVPDEVSALLESRDEYTAEGVFWIPPEARWGTLQDQAKQAGVGTRIDAAMDAIERENPSLRGVLPKNFARPGLDQRRLGELVDLIGSLALGGNGNGHDLLGRVYEYFLGQFALAEGRNAGQFYTPRCIVKLLVEMLEPYSGRVYDPCCGSGGMFVQSEVFVEAHGGGRNDISIFGQEANETTWRLAKMNLAIRGIEADLGPRWADTFHDDLQPDLKADYLLANPPFNLKDWGGDQLRDDRRWKYGTPPTGNANYAWLQHMASKLGPHGTAGVVLANGSLSSQQSGEGAIRKAMVEDDLIECIVALPGQLFYNTQIPACLWLLNRNKSGSGPRRGRDRRGELLLVDARELGQLVDRTHKDLSNDDVARIADTFHAWRTGEEYSDVPGFCASASVDAVRDHNFVLTPGRYVGAAEQEEDDEPIAEKVARLKKELLEAFDESDRLQRKVRQALVRIDG